MDTTVLDIIYFLFIGLVVVGGVACIVIFLPKEHKMWDDTEDCYRICQRNGVYSITDRKANFFESRKDYIYLKKFPFQVDGFVSGVKSKDEMCYKATADITVQFPPEMIAVAAPVFGGSNQESIVDTISEVISTSLKDVIENGDISDEVFKTSVTEVLKKKLLLFGVEVMVINDLRLSADRTVE